MWMATKTRSVYLVDEVKYALDHENSCRKYTKGKTIAAILFYPSYHSSFRMKYQTSHSFSIYYRRKHS